MEFKNWKERLLYLREEYYKKKYPNVHKDHGIPKAKPYKDTTSNGLQKAIQDFLIYSGWDCQRHNTMGVPRTVNGRTRWTYSGGRKGGADLHAIIKGRHVSIEVKIGRDVMSNDQHKERQRVEGAGGVYVTTSSMDNFLAWYDKNYSAI